MGFCPLYKLITPTCGLPVAALLDGRKDDFNGLSTGLSGDEVEGAVAPLGRRVDVRRRSVLAAGNGDES